MIPIPPSLMLFSPTWRRVFPGSIWALSQRRYETRQVIMLLQIMAWTYYATIRWHEMNVSPQIVRTPDA